MSKNRTIVIAATHPLQCTGYARVGATLANGLAERGWRVVYWGYQNLTPASGRTMHAGVRVIDVGERVGDGWSFGQGVFKACVDDVQPDIVLLYNDVMILNSFLDVLPPQGATRPYSIVCYMDMVHANEHPGLVTGILTRSDMQWVFADRWKRELEMRGATHVHTVPHGMDQAMTQVMDQAMTTTISKRNAAKKSLGIDESTFLVVNTNRNSYRKCLDLTVDGFLRFWKTHPDARLMLNNVGSTDSGYDIPHVVDTSARALGLHQHIPTLLESVIMGVPNGGFLDDRLVATMYMAADVCVNTCNGEGFGLCALEGACLETPQIATKTGGLVDILDGHPPHQLLDPVVQIQLPRGFVQHGGMLDIVHPDSVAHALETVYTTKKTTLHEQCRESAETLRTQFDWTAILDRVDHILSPQSQKLEAIDEEGA
jgi:glycosyltransferase involved in cell wall biosynthesis